MRFALFDMYMYMMIGVNYSQNNTNQTEKNPGLSIIFLLILSNTHLYERTGNKLGENLQIKLALTCEG